ncbi:MAG: twin-arginine translocation signal domain-containing protein, partial [Phycisphaerae bacterium]
MKSRLNRRDFLRLAGMAGACAALAPAAMRLLADTQQSGKARPDIVMDALKRDPRATSETVFCYKDYNHLRFPE